MCSGSPVCVCVCPQVTLEGSVFEKVFEADPNITYTFTWNKRNVYKQKVSLLSLLASSDSSDSFPFSLLSGLLMVFIILFSKGYVRLNLAEWVFLYIVSFSPQFFLYSPLYLVFKFVIFIVYVFLVFIVVWMVLLYVLDGRSELKGIDRFLFVQ